MGLRRRKIGIVVVALLMLTTGSWLLFHPREPMYGGRPLSFWLKGYDQRGMQLWTEWKSDYAIRKIGTDAIPFLLKEIQAKDSNIKLKFAEWAMEHDVFHLQWSNFRMAQDRQDEALRAFEALGADARFAVPALIRIYEDDPSPESRSAVLRAFASIGPFASNAVPVLFRDFQTTNGYFDQGIWVTLGIIHGRPDLVVPVVTNLLTNANPEVRFEAFRLLGKYSTVEGPIVPFDRLLEAVTESDETNTTPDAVIDLLSFHRAQADWVVLYLIRGLSDTNDYVQWRAAELLADFGSNSLSAVPYLLTALGDNSHHLRTLAASALLQISPHDAFATRPALAWLRSQLENTDIEARVDAAIALFRANPNDDHAFDVIVACMRMHSPPRVSDTELHSIRLVGNLGPLGKPFVPTLIGLLPSGNSEYHVSEFADEALRKIDPEAHDKALEEFVKQMK